MRYLQASKQTLHKAGYSVPAQANSFFPIGNQQKFAEEGNVFVTYVSFKRDDAFWFRLSHNDADGYFSFPPGHSADDLDKSWVDALRALNMVRGLCSCGLCARTATDRP